MHSQVNNYLLEISDCFVRNPQHFHLLVTEKIIEQRIAETDC
jgi:hypothetical protein